MKQMTIIGHLGADATTKDVNGNQFVDFSVAVNQSYKKADNTQVESTQWFSCSTKNLNIAPHLRKGDQVMVQGNFNTTVYQDKLGKWNAGINLHASNIQLLTPKSEHEEKEGLTFLRKIVREELTRNANPQ